MACLLLAFPTLVSAQRVEGVRRFGIGTDPDVVTVTGPARPGVFLGDQGRRSAVLGVETGAFEVWVWPLKLVRDLRLAFRVPEYDEPIPGEAVVRTVETRADGATIVYSHASFTVRQHVLVPMDEPGALFLLDVETVRPLEVLVQMHADFGLAWPGSFGGGYITWQAGAQRFLLSQGGVAQYNGFVGSPFAEDGTSHPAHDAPTAPSQFVLRFDASRTRDELVPIVVAGGAASRDSVDAAYRRILGGAERLWREKVEHYDAVREGQLSVRSPDASLDRALEWSKVNLDQQMVCNPDLGCGLVAGFGRAGPGNFRPGFGWFFGGDAAINSLAMDAIGQFEAVRTGLEFLASYQRDDGKIPHEISQSAARLPWFTDYPYTWFHGDTTPFWILACHAYWTASGDDDFLRQLWPRIAKAFRWSAAADADGDGLMENPIAGAGAIEVGGLGEGLLTDVYLAGVWVAALDGVREMARAAGDVAVAGDAEALHERARASMERAFWLEEAGIYAFALLAGGTAGRPRTNPALTVWPATAVAFGVLDAARADRMLQRIGSHALTADWGVRTLSREHELYDPLHYNNGTVWGFVTGFAALAHYRAHRGWAGHDLVRDVARSTFDFARGRNPELMSGAFYRTLDTTVPQQFFATSMFVSPLVRGLLGLSADAPNGRVVIAPHLPAAWDSVRVDRFRAGDAMLAVEVVRSRGEVSIRLTRTAGAPLDVELSPALPLGARLRAVHAAGQQVAPSEERTAHDLHAPVSIRLDREAVVTWSYDGGLEVDTPPEALTVGAPSRSLRVLDFRADGGSYAIDVEGLAGERYILDLRAGPGSAARPLDADVEAIGTERGIRLRFALPQASTATVRRTLRVAR